MELKNKKPESLHEGFKSYAIKIYQCSDKYEYENSFMHGEADTLKNLFAKLTNRNLEWDLIYYYDDINDVKLGAFEPALRDRKSKGRLYLGKINLSLDLNTMNTEHSVKYLSKNKNRQVAQEKFIQKLKKQAKREEFLKSIRDGLVKLINIFKKDR